MSNQIIRKAYAIVAAHGINTSNMTPSEVIDKMNEIEKPDNSWERRVNEHKLIEKGYKKEDLEKLNDEEIKTKNYAQKIVNIDDEIKNLKEELSPKETKEHDVIIDKNTGKYVRFTPTGIELTSDKDLATLGQKTEKILNSHKALKKLDIDPIKSSVKIEREKYIPYSQEQAIEAKIKHLQNKKSALQSGYGEDVETYIKEQNKKLEEFKNQKKRDIENSYYGKSAKSSMEKYYSENSRVVIPSETAMELFARRAKALGAEEIHSSAKKGERKYEASIYLKIGNTEIRLSNHEIPDTAEREFAKSEGRTSRWDKEIIMDSTTLDEMIKHKTQKEFDNWVKSYFNE